MLPFGRFGGSGTHFAQEPQTFRRQAHRRPPGEQARLEVARRLGPMTREFEAGRAAEFFVQHVEPANGADAVGTRPSVDCGDQVPDARFQHQSERIDLARDRAFPSLVVEPHARVVPERGGKAGQYLGRLGTRIPAVRVEVKARTDALGPRSGSRRQAREHLELGCGRVRADAEVCGRLADTREQERLGFRGREAGERRAVALEQAEAAVAAALGKDRDARGAQLVHVAVDGPDRDVEAARE